MQKSTTIIGVLEMLEDVFSLITTFVQDIRLVIALSLISKKV